jgi:homoserine dehydrogenase
MGRAYLRLTAADDPKVLGTITGALGEEGVGTASIVQRKASGGGDASIIILTQTASEAALRGALAKIEDFPAVTGTPRVIRIEEEV